MNIRDILQEFRDNLDGIMIKCMHESVMLYGYESYTGRFIKWYAKYYHNIDIAYLVSTDMSRGRAYDMEVFRPSILDFDYKNVSNSVIWVTEPMTDDIKASFEQRGLKEGETFFDFYRAIYNDDIYSYEKEETDVYNRKKTGQRDIQFLEWLEWKYGCNFVTRIPQNEIVNRGKHNSGYGVTTQKEIFEILDKCHCHPSINDAIFDFGCGKGGALLSFLDYGFMKIGGVEYDPHIYEILVDNFNRLSLDITNYYLVNGDAVEQDKILDDFNWFYFYAPFDGYVFDKCEVNIRKSLERRLRRIWIIVITPVYKDIFERSGMFRLYTQFTIDLRQRVVNIYETY